MNIQKVKRFKMYNPDGTEDAAISWVTITSSDDESCSTGYPNGRYDEEIKKWVDAGNTLEEAE